jgi:tetratricopeptide (TPR) repeat protein
LRARGATDAIRVTTASLGAAWAGYAVAAAFDWIWELTAVTLVAVAVLALAVGPATATPAPLRAIGRGAGRPWVKRSGLGVAVLVVAWVLVVAQAIPLLAQRQVDDSEAAVDHGDLAKALSAAGAARDIQPWAATPYLQLALVSEKAGRLRRARVWIDEAIDRDPRDWRLWLVAARVETKLGRLRTAQRSLNRAISLNPRSPLLRSLR